MHLHASSLRRKLVWFAFALALPVGTATAQPANAATSPPPSTVSEPASSTRVISVQDVLVRTEEDQQRVEWAKRLLAAPDPAGHLRVALDDIARPIDAKMQATAGGTLRSLPVMRLESLARHWQFDERRFARWQDRARRAFAPYADSTLELAQRKAAWSATRAAGVLDQLPSPLSERVDTLLSQIDATERLLGERLARHGELMQRASEMQSRIQAGRSDVAVAIDDIDRRLLQIDAPALWRGLGTSAGSEAAWATMKRGVEIERQYATDYHEAGAGNQLALRVVQFLVLPLILWLFMRSRHAHAPDGTPDRVARALRRPVSTWLLLSMLAVIVLEPDAPLLVQEFALLVALVPVLRLLPSATRRAYGVWPYIAIALYGLDRLGVAVVADSNLYRLFLLALAGLAIGLTVWMLRQPQRMPAMAGHSLRRITTTVAWMVLAVLAVAVVANVWGNVSLAETLTSGVIDSGYMALLLYASVTACLGIFRALLGQPELAGRRPVRQHGAMLQAGFARLLVLGASLGWLLYSMSRFRVLRPLQELGARVLSLGIDVGEVSIHLGDVLVFGVSAWLAVWAARGVRRVLRDELPNHGGLPRGVGNSIASLSYYGVLSMGLLVALSAAGFKVSQLALVFGALGVGIGFGLQNVVNNFVSGLVLMFERPIQPGDMIEVGAVAGTVREIGLRATTIRTYDGADVVVPNGSLVSGNLTNWTMFDRSRRFEVAVSVAYGCDPAQVMALLETTARAMPGIAEQPAPFAQMTGYGDSALNFVLRAWTQDIGTWGSLRSDLFARTLAAMQAAGIEIPHNQLDVHLRSTPEPRVPSETAGGMR